MTREELIKQAAERFADREHGAMRDVSVFNLLQYAFKCGAEWADDNYLAQVWHPASEQPQEIDAQIICRAASLTCPERMTYVETTLRGIMHISSSWQDWTRRNNLKAWAYVNDLLPSAKCLVARQLLSKSLKIR